MATRLRLTGLGPPLPRGRRAGLFGPVRGQRSSARGDRWIHESSTQPRLSAASAHVRSAIEAHGSALAFWAAISAATAGPVTAAATPGRSCVLASIGIRKNALTSTSARHAEALPSVGHGRYLDNKRLRPLATNHDLEGLARAHRSWAAPDQAQASSCKDAVARIGQMSVATIDRPADRVDDVRVPRSVDEDCRHVSRRFETAARSPR